MSGLCSLNGHVARKKLRVCEYHSNLCLTWFSGSSIQTGSSPTACMVGSSVQRGTLEQGMYEWGRAPTGIQSGSQALTRAGPDHAPG